MSTTNDDIDTEMGDATGTAVPTTATATATATSTTTTTTATSTTTAPEPMEVDATIIKRRAIQKIMKDTSIDAKTKRFRIQQLMDGSSTSSTVGSGLLSASSTGVGVSIGASMNTSICMSTSTCTGTGTSTNTSVNHHTGTSDVMACVHYERRCNIVAPCCGGIFGCRVCHDEMVTDGHEMDRFMVREIVCKECHTRQERSNKCIKCGITFGEYHCNICNLWMSKAKKPFHCDKCGFCRVGGREKFIHCDACSMCISIDTFDNHICLKDKFKNNCPVCREDMHTSRHASLDLPCGHAIHTHCFRKLAAFDYRCPICKKTVVNSESMSRAWEERSREIRSQPMPPDLARKVDIWCNDCEVKSENQDWHFLGVRCPSCNSFNTAVENIVSRRSTSTSTRTNTGGGGDQR